MLIGFWGNQWYMVALSIVGGIILTSGEVAAVRVFATTSSKFWLVVAIGCAIMSIGGSFGALQIGYMKNITKSDAYTQKLKHIQQIDDQMDIVTKQSKAFVAKGWLINARKVNAEMSELIEKKSLLENQLNSIGQSGTGEGNALYNAFGQLFDYSPLMVALFINLFVAIVFEILLIGSEFHLTRLRDTQPVATRPTCTCNPEVAYKATPDEGGQYAYLYGTNNSKPATKQIQLTPSEKKSKILTLISTDKYTRKEIADQCNVSRQYVDKVVNKNKKLQCNQMKILVS